MYAVFILLVTAGLIWLTVSGARNAKPDKIKKLLFINLIVSASSAIIGIITPFAVHGKIFLSNSSDEWKEWAWDSFKVFLNFSLPLLAVLMLLTCGSALVSLLSEKTLDTKHNPELRKNIFSFVIRPAASVSASVIMMLTAAFYAYMADESMQVFILIIGICEAFVLRLMFVIELALKLKKSV